MKKKLFGEILQIFIIVVVSNMLVDIADNQKKFLPDPVKFFGLALAMSIVGGIVAYRAKIYFEKEAESKRKMKEEK
jgi:hypothetical protein